LCLELIQQPNLGNERKSFGSAIAHNRTMGAKRRFTEHRITGNSIEAARHEARRHHAIAVQQA
jgi:hypothetical protein